MHSLSKILSEIAQESKTDSSLSSSFDQLYAPLARVLPNPAISIQLPRVNNPNMSSTVSMPETHEIAQNRSPIPNSKTYAPLSGPYLIPSNDDFDDYTVTHRYPTRYQLSQQVHHIQLDDPFDQLKH